MSRRQCHIIKHCSIFFFFFNDTATTEIYTLSLHDALPIYQGGRHVGTAAEAFDRLAASVAAFHGLSYAQLGDRKSTRLNSSHLVISYAVFCLKKKKYAEYGFRLNEQKSRMYRLA